jgi:7-cyano-7-deazaguanine synthase
MEQTKPRAVVLLSGGLDSTTTLAMARAEGRECYCLTVRYGQRHEHELAAAQRVAKQLAATKHMVLDVDLRPIGGSALTADIEVPKDQEDEGTDHIPITYVPARNTLLLSLALGWAEVVEATEIWLGVSAVDYSGYPDCRPAFIDAFQQVANQATRAAVEGGTPIQIRAPLIHLSKAETVRRGLALGVDYAMTHTCYDPAPSGESCGRCDACRLRQQAFAELNLTDPVPYQ